MTAPILPDTEAQPSTGLGSTLTTAINSLFMDRPTGMLDEVIRARMLGVAEAVGRASTETSAACASTLAGHINEFRGTDGFSNAKPYHNILKTGLVKELEALLHVLAEAGA